MIYVMVCLLVFMLGVGMLCFGLINGRISLV